MSKRFRLITAAAAVAVAVVVIVVVKSGGGSNGPSATGTTTIRITVKQGAVEGGLAHPTVKQGSRVVIRVTADVSDEVHLHGYDIARNVTPQTPAVISFTAKLPGRFEAELEGRKQQILELTVEP